MKRTKIPKKLLPSFTVEMKNSFFFVILSTFAYSASIISYGNDTKLKLLEYSNIEKQKKWWRKMKMVPFISLLPCQSLVSVKENPYR